MSDKFWLEIPFHFPFVELGEFVVMPNHIHGIIVIDQINLPDFLQPFDPGVSDQFNLPDFLQTPESGVSTDIPSTRTAAASKKWKPGILGVIINQYKRICTIHTGKIDLNFGWQTRFYDHIIRSDSNYQRISTYIRDNIAKWEGDQFYYK